MTEYINISPSENAYSQKNMLSAQIDLLNSAKHIRTYKSLRKEELALKILIKTKISEIYEQMNILDKLLPRTKEEKQSSALAYSAEEQREEIKLEIESNQSHDILEKELNEIRAKLARIKSS